MNIITIAISNTCDAQCQFCDVGQRNSLSSIGRNYAARPIVSPKPWIDTINRIIGNERPIIHLNGVEPLLYPHLAEFLQLGAKQSYRFWITTNANRFFSDGISDIIRDCCENVAISIDGITAHDHIRGVPGLFDRAIQAIRYLKKNQVRTSCVICPSNQNELMNLYGFVRQVLNVPIVFNHYNYIAGISNDYFNLEKIDIQNLYNLIRFAVHAIFIPNLHTIEQLKRYYHHKPQTRIKRTGGCNILNQIIAGKRLSLLSDGTIIPATRCWLTVDMGNIFSGMPKLDQLREIAQDIAERGFPPQCQRLCCAGNLVEE
ncbi:MAG: radical SAM protein [candidate division KSB1 bacterium]|nr:radical SAM protein [candidate division KSB1 bacterium]